MSSSLLTSLLIDQTAFSCRAFLYCLHLWINGNDTQQGGITCGAIDEPRKSSEAIDKRVIIDFRDKNVVIARFRDKNEVFI